LNDAGLISLGGDAAGEEASAAGQDSGAWPRGGYGVTARSVDAGIELRQQTSQFIDARPDAVGLGIDRVALQPARSL
jgi:hypothetical protein